ncbi:unnamed protein product [Larinioides sclopetarius]|uniref:U6 snRNA m(6)A methyltransferase n=1 Tax=Larinioides sclopetarius TaxID=280406 RepID=A0AAV2BFQ2_9ARAC
MSFNSLMHERNIYKDRPDFAKIAIDYPEFRKYAIPNRKGKLHVNFNDPNALRMVTRVLLKKDFELDVEIPDGYLIPTVPQRLNYILWIEDLLTILPKNSENVSGIDIGTGPCAILSLLGSKKNGWHFVSTETADEAVQWAKKNIENNNLESHIKVAKVNKGKVLHDVMVENVENFDFCVCNPPFFENKDDIRKKRPRIREKLELFAKKDEIFSDGGEVSFVKQLLKDSLILKDRIRLYSSMFGKKKSFIEMLKELQCIEGISYTKTEFCQGNTIRWGIAWTFIKDVNFEKIERPKPQKPKKAKPPLVHSISRKLKDFNILTLQEILGNIKSTLYEFQIETKIIKSANNYAEIEILSYQNTWSHQRRKRREQLKGTEEHKKTDMKNEAFPSVNMADLNDISLEKQSPDSSKSIPVAAVFCTDLEKGQAAESETKPCLPFQINEDEGNKQKAKSEDDHFDTVSLDEQNKTKAIDSSENLKDSISQKRRRDGDEPALNIDSKMQHNKDEKCILLKSPESNASPEAKRFKISEDPIFSNERKRKIQFDSSPKKKICVTGVHSDQGEESMNLESVHTTNPVKTFETIPLLYSVIKLRMTKENILLEMNCPPECNRETMHQVFQLFKNKIRQ